jgi:hypothetical protein
MIAIELTEVDFEATPLQLGSDAAAATIDRQYVIARSVRNEEPRLSVFVATDDKPRRERDDAVEKIAIDQAQ